ncbi:MAG: class I SAM-dependent methyltransferase [Ignavibacteriales bacterium]|nr:class I SAM-dependent methyltransferase [Ignavibacteriales bacterium]
MDVDINRLKKIWEELAEEDPFWAILSCPQKKGRKWEVDEFFATGVNEIQDLMNFLGRKNIIYKKFHALDFGCGVGRLTQPLTNYFDFVTGLDISPKMIELSIKFNQKDNARYILNQQLNLSCFLDESFSFIYSNIVLQHIPKNVTFNYLKEFSRVLCEGGILVFQLPDRMTNKIFDALWNNDFVHKWIYPFFLQFRGKLKSRMELHPICKEKVETFIINSSLNLLEIIENRNSGPNWISYTYVVKK